MNYVKKIQALEPPPPKPKSYSAAKWQKSTLDWEIIHKEDKHITFTDPIRDWSIIDRKSLHIVDSIGDQTVQNATR